MAEVWPNCHISAIIELSYVAPLLFTVFGDIGARLIDIPGQSEHLSLLVGSGLTIGIGAPLGIAGVDMRPALLLPTLNDQILARAKEIALSAKRGEFNLEDELGTALALLQGLTILQDERASELQAALRTALSSLVLSILHNEERLKAALDPDGSAAMATLLGFLLSFASRAASRERLNIFTTNYDRLIEYGCDTLGLRIIDRFVGTIAPEFRASRLSIDYHYNPPGIRGEPRFVEGVVRLTKLHGSIDWRLSHHRLIRSSLPFGAPATHSEAPSDALAQCMIFPNAAKDVETLLFPYAELFRDFASAVCQPNSTLVVYGYGFGDDHINRVIRDMLTVPSTHLVVIAWGDPHGRAKSFCDSVGRPAQISLLIGPHFGDLSVLVGRYLPKPAIDAISFRKAILVERRGEGWSHGAHADDSVAEKTE